MKFRIVIYDYDPADPLVAVATVEQSADKIKHKLNANAISIIVSAKPGETITIKVPK